MALVNRDKDASEQQVVVSGDVSSTATGATYALLVVPYPCQLMGAKTVAIGLSGAPNHSLWIQRWAAAGVTSINIGSSLVAQNFSVSGAQSFAVPGGATFLLQEGDAVLATAAANTAATHVHVQLVVKALQDIKSHFGV